MADLESMTNEELQAHLESLKANKLAAKQAELPWYSPKQLAFDVGSGTYKAAAGLGDILKAPVIAAANLEGADLPYFGMSKMAGEDIANLAKTLEMKPETTTQEIVSFVAPSPLSKAKLLTQALEGGATYLGSKAGEYATGSPYGGLIGGVLGAAAAKGAVVTSAKIAPALEEAGQGLERSSLGIRTSDYTKKRGNRFIKAVENENPTIETLPSDYQTQVKKSADNLIETNALGTTRDAKKLHSNLVEEKNNIENLLQSRLESAQKEVGPIPLPDTSKTLKYIIDNADVHDEEKYLNKLQEKLDTLQQKGGGKLTYLNEQKRKLANEWKKDPNLDTGFWRSLYLDYKDHIEKYAPEVKDLNKQKQDLLVLEPILEREARASETAITPQKLGKALLYTSGGLGIPAAYAAGGPIGAALALGLGALGTKKGQSAIGKTLGSIGEALPTQTDILSNPLVSAAIVAGKTLPETKEKAAQIITTDPKIARQARIDELKAQLEKLSLPSIENKKSEIFHDKYSALLNDAAAKHNIDPSLLHAVVEQESKFNSKAIGPNTRYGRAKGLMQIMPAVAESLGITDPYNAEQNIAGGTQLLADLTKQYGDEKLALAAYNWRPKALNNQLKMLKAKGIEPTWENLVAYGDVPSQTEEYVPSVLKKRKKYIG
jgi:Transglycosylase SLT domain